MQAKPRTRIGKIFADGRKIDAALRSAAREAVRAHQKHNAPLVVWHEGRTVLVPPRALTGTAAGTTRKPSPRRSR